MGVRLLEVVRKANCWDVQRCVMWTVALDVLYWLRCHKRKYTTYVANRVGEVLRYTDVDNWRWVPTDQNPADWGTKYGTRDDPSMWWKGPKFLHEEEDLWPNSTTLPKTVLELKETKTLLLVRV